MTNLWYWVGQYFWRVTPPILVLCFGLVLESKIIHFYPNHPFKFSFTHLMSKKRLTFVDFCQNILISESETVDRNRLDTVYTEYNSMYWVTMLTCGQTTQHIVKHSAQQFSRHWQATQHESSNDAKFRPTFHSTFFRAGFEGPRHMVMVEQSDKRDWYIVV